MVLLCPRQRVNSTDGRKDDYSLTLVLSLHLPVHINRDGNDKDEYVEVMRAGPLPDIREIPDCPRKKVDARTMAEHRSCFKASEDRIRVALRHGGNY